jgi:CBS domain-containing protein
MGFEVYDYEAGKADWGSAGLPLEGDDPSSRRAGAFARRDPPTCTPSDRLQDVRERATELGMCFVVDADGVVLGRLGRKALRREDDVAAEEAMSPGPGTLRPSARLQRAVDWMRKRGATSAPITTSDGRLYGLLLLADAERNLG